MSSRPNPQYRHREGQGLQVAALLAEPAVSASRRAGLAGRCPPGRIRSIGIEKGRACRPLPSRPNPQYQHREGQGLQVAALPAESAVSASGRAGLAGRGCLASGTAA
ncbi:hypothetical protein DQX05_19775 [Paenibacillus thiaminolyticus]|uniref:Uncharacterized protein n=1 Tax=Paenibacillus thiaminolyticus TaxID=49283 RepID=A0A3A3GFI7_PANTH|nr:hypothetical protein DQX05_19775 [Paenibacillus thiaminolyticus]